jgi:HTH-type transcriptional regulator / antitoxin HipB
MDFLFLAEMIQFHRKKAGLSRNELAVIADVGKTVIYDIEHGKQTIHFQSVMKILSVLNIQLDFKSPFMDAFKQNKNT